MGEETGVSVSVPNVMDGYGSELGGQSVDTVVHVGRVALGASTFGLL
jgi:hypothetical protein